MKKMACNISIVRILSDLPVPGNHIGPEVLDFLERRDQLLQSAALALQFLLILSALLDLHWVVTNFQVELQFHGVGGWK
jgi:hypothetical protein